MHRIIISRCLAGCLLHLASGLCNAQDEHNTNKNTVIIEEFTAHTLGVGQVKLGTDLEVGLGNQTMIGTDLVAQAVGAQTAFIKREVFHDGDHRVALGLRGTYINRKTMLWGQAKEQFDTLDGRFLRPSLAWTHTLSPRLELHTFWSKGFGRLNVKLSPKGQRTLWEAKHPDSDYDTRDQLTQKPQENGGTQSTNQEETSASRENLAVKTLHVQSISGFYQERFQLTGEFSRDNGNRILVSTRIETADIDKLHSQVVRLTAAHHWIWPSFQTRIGFGPQYFATTGRDLDGETIDQSGYGPASDIAFYWIF